MNASTLTSPPKNQTKLSDQFKKVSGVLICAALLLGILGLRQGWWGNLEGRSGPAEAPADRASSTSTVETKLIVQLSLEKLAQAKLHLAEVVERPLRDMRTVPGSLIYDEAKHLELTAPVDSVVSEVLVEPGQIVAAATPLVVLFSSEVGLARDEVFKREAELKFAQREEQWAVEIAANVEALLTLLKSKPKLTEVEASLEDKKLGDYREKIISAYSKLVLADLTVGNTESLNDVGAISKRLIDERRSMREVATALFQGSCETSKFAAAQQKDKATATAEQADRLLTVSREKLATLLGPLADMSEVRDHKRLGELTVCAPLAGRIDERFVVKSARLVAGKPLFTLADTSNLWVSAEIHEQDWAALDTAIGSSLALRVPAMNNASFLSKVRFIGSKVSPEKRSIPLVADLPNPAGKFRPGMFVWVDVPLDRERQALVVPQGAVMRHEQQAFVFVPQVPEGYRRVDVVTGLEREEWIEIVKGLRGGDKVVDEGAFFLKSELLLEREKD